jgi:hypothetical protein
MIRYLLCKLKCAMSKHEWSVYGWGDLRGVSYYDKCVHCPARRNEGRLRP